MSSLHDRAQRVPGAIRAVLLVPCFVLPIVWGFTYSGPYRWLAEWQLGSSGSYDVLWTGIILVLVMLIAAVIVVQTLSRVYEGGDTLEAARARIERTAQREAWLLSHRWRIVGVMAALSFSVIGAYFLARGLLAGELTRLPVATLEAGAEPPSTYVDVEGELRTSEGFTIEEKGNGSTIQKVYIPVVSKGQPARGARVYLETYDTWLTRYASDLRSGRYRGVLSENALPGIATTILKKRGVDLPGRYWVLDYQKSPQSLMETGQVFGILGVVTWVVTGIAWVVLARRER